MEEDLKKFKEKTAGMYEEKAKSIHEEQKKKEKDLFDASKFKAELNKSL